MYKYILLSFDCEKFTHSLNKEQILAPKPNMRTNSIQTMDAYCSCGHVPKLIGGNPYCKPYARTLCAHLRFLIISYYFLLLGLITFFSDKGLGVGPYVKRRYETRLGTGVQK